MNDKFHSFIALTATPNWDDEHGFIISAEAWQGAWLIYQLFKKHDLPEPFISPCGDGSIHFTFHLKDKRLNMEYRGNLAFVSEVAFGVFRDLKRGTLIQAVQSTIEWFNKEKI